MKSYKFELIVKEGNDEFWESLENKSGTDEVHNLISNALADYGLFDRENCILKLKEFCDE